MSLLKVNKITAQSGSMLEISGTVVSSSMQISASAFYGDGTNLTGVTAEWDGTHTGTGSIVGSLTVTETLTLGTSTSHIHHISGSLNLYGGVVKVPTTNKIDVYGTVDAIHSTQQIVTKDMTLPDAHNGVLMGPVICVQTGSTITVGTGSILHIMDPCCSC